jgi:hypothetical protein
MWTATHTHTHTHTHERFIEICSVSSTVFPDSFFLCCCLFSWHYMFVFLFSGRARLGCGRQIAPKAHFIRVTGAFCNCVCYDTHLCQVGVPRVRALMCWCFCWCFRQAIRRYLPSSHPITFMIGSTCGATLSGVTFS